MYFQFPFLGIFPCTLRFQWFLIMCRQKSFNSRFLGFFHAPRALNCAKIFLKSFQFPFLGIFPCTVSWLLPYHRKDYTAFNSRFLGFFHAPQGVDLSASLIVHKLSIPVSWDFSMHQADVPPGKEGEDIFQFPFLGIFPCTIPDPPPPPPADRVSFQFPFLGIFPCTWCKPVACEFPDLFSFNSRFLGFFHAPLPQHKPCTYRRSALSIPVSWDFSMHHKFSFFFVVFLALSIPVSWDFSMHQSSFHSLAGATNRSFNSRFLGFFHAPD